MMCPRFLPVVALLPLLACSEYNLGQKPDSPEEGLDTDPPLVEGCDLAEVLPEELGLGTECPDAIEVPPGGFQPIVEWSGGSGRTSKATVAVGDLDGDGRPEIVVNESGLLPGGKGDLVAYYGDGSGILWENTTADLGYASSPALGDIDGDGDPEVVCVRDAGGGLLGLSGSYRLVAFDHQGDLLWETPKYDGDNFDYASGVVLSDMDHDGEVEIVAGRMIFDAQGNELGQGQFGRGSWGLPPVFGISEASVPAVADIDLDGVEEVVVGNAVYAMDGSAMWSFGSLNDGMVGIANLDDDPEAEIVASSFDTVRVMDTDGSVIWGPTSLPGANIVSTPAIADLDRDGDPELVVAGGNALVAFHHDGAEMWKVDVQDESGASGPSIFDFEGDGWPEVVYLDEIQMIAVDGVTGVVKFQTNDHASVTMMDYPVIADVDSDGHAEIVVSHSGHGRAFSVYGEATDTWAPARRVWNQHAYAISNINDDLSIPTNPAPSFTTHNTWHSALPEEGSADYTLIDDVEAEIVEVCDLECDEGTVLVVGRLLNRSSESVPLGIPVSLYVVDDQGGETWVAMATTAEELAPGWSSSGLTYEVSADLAETASAFLLMADDSGDGIGVLEECSETNNDWLEDGPFCEE